MSAEILQEGSITLPAKKLGEIVNNLSPDDVNGDIEIELKDNNRIVLKNLKSRFQLTGISKEDYPALPEFHEDKAVSFSSATMVEMIQKTIFSVSTDETRYVLNGVLLILSKKDAAMVATNGRRLAIVKRQNVLQSDMEAQVIVPVKALQEALKIAAHHETDLRKENSFLLEVARNQIAFRWADTTLFSRLMEGNFPNWEQVIPKQGALQAIIPRDGFLAATKRASLCIADRVGTCSYKFFKNRCEITSRTLGHYEFEEAVEIKDFQGAEGFEIVFNPSYVLDFLKVVPTSTFHASFSTSVNPALFAPPDDIGYQYVVMPSRQQEK